jgi:hypothetical protein
MFIRIRTLIILLLFSLAGANHCNATGATFFEIYSGERQAFSGSIYLGSNDPHYDLMANMVALARINSFANPKMPEEDIVLKGDITIKPRDLPSMQLKSLRLIFIKPDTDGLHGPPHWIIHQNDVAQIEAYYKPIATRMRSQEETFAIYERWLPIGIPIAVVVGSVILLFCVLLAYSRHRVRQSTIST